MIQEDNREIITTTHFLSSFSKDRIRMTEDIFRILIPIINKVHGTAYSDRFWKLLLKDYVNSIISKKNVLSSHLHKAVPGFEPINSFSIPSVGDRVRNSGIRLARFIRSLKNRNEVHAQLTGGKDLTFSFPDLPEVRRELGEPVPTFFPFPMPFSGERTKRKQLNALASAYEDVFIQNVIRQVPQVLIEYFRDMVRNIPVVDPASRVFHVHNLHSTHATFLVALYIEQGTKLIWYQHGGYYGELEGHNSHYFESSLADTYRTWGWKIRNNDEPWKAYRLEKFKLAYDIANPLTSNILLCSPRINKFNRDYYELVVSGFLKALNFEKFQKIIIRPRPGYKDRSPKSQFTFVKGVGNVEIDDASKPIASFVKGSKLVVHLTYPSTNFLECLYVGKPSIALLLNDQPTDIVKPYYDFFLNNGVFHYDIESLVDWINRTDIEKWWYRLTTETIYVDFKNQFLKGV